MIPEGYRELKCFEEIKATDRIEVWATYWMDVEDAAPGSIGESYKPGEHLLRIRKLENTLIDGF